jgi:hypothetical protein
MKENCECPYCKEKINKYFCLSCGYNFNECEVMVFLNQICLCPKCHIIEKKDENKR